ncbi:MAG: Gfo/Idh/MocA family oxidoreductase [Planctomycetota bacterium]
MGIAAANEAVITALRARRIGTPVSVRIVDHGTSEIDAVESRLARALEAASRWLDADVRRLAALGGFQSGQVSVLMEFRQGQTALVSAGTHGRGRPLVEVVVVGNRGVLSWEPGPEPMSGDERPKKAPSPAARQLLDAVRRSLESHGPVSLAGGVAPEEAPAVEAPPRVADQAPDTPARPIRPKPPYGVLLVAGAHTHQENYAEDLAADPRCRLIGLTDEPDVPQRRRALNQKLAQRLGIPLIADLNEALAREDVHVVSVCAEPERRARVMVRSAEAGKHLYLDKPMTASVEEAEAVARAVRTSGVVSQMFSQVHWPASARLRQLVDSGSLGELKALHLDLTFAKGPAGTVPIDKPRVEQKNPRRFELVDSKRELYNVGVYQCVLLDWLLGRRVRRVWAVTANYFFAEHKRNDMEDFGVVLMELEGGVTATLAAGRTGWRSHPMGGMNRTCLIGSSRVASIDASRPRLETWADENPWLPPKRHPEDPMGFWKSTYEEVDGAPKQAWVTPPGTGRSDAAHFLDCIEEGRPSDVSADHGARAVKVLMAAYESAATGRFVTPAE